VATSPAADRYPRWPPITAMPCLARRTKIAVTRRYARLVPAPRRSMSEDSRTRMPDRALPAVLPDHWCDQCCWRGRNAEARTTFISWSWVWCRPSDTKLMITTGCAGA